MRLTANDSVALLTASVVVDVCFLLLNFARIVFVSDRLTAWYVDLGTSAIAMDVTIIFIVTTLGVHLASSAMDDPTLWGGAVCVLSLQVAHDVAFAATFTAVPRGASYVLDVFKNYAAEVRFHAIWSDSLMVLGCFFLAEGLCRAGTLAQGIALAASVYGALFALYTKTPRHLLTQT